MPNALVIGATGCLGQAVARKAAERGFNVIGAAPSPMTSPSFQYIRMDVRDESSIQTASQELPKLNLVACLQGYQPQFNLDEADAGHVAAMLETHVNGTLLCLKYLGDHFAPESCVILISSVAIRKGSYDPAYAAAKGAIAALTRSLANELRHRTRVNCLAPGLIEDSPVHRSMTADQSQRHFDRMFMRRLVQASDVADLALHVYENTSINAAVIPIDGGYFD